MPSMSDRKDFHELSWDGPLPLRCPALIRPPLVLLINRIGHSSSLYTTKTQLQSGLAAGNRDFCNAPNRHPLSSDVA